jgi:putative PIN family toxin of toxin-antitoxin system
MKVVLDVNVWISALLWGGLPAKLLSLSRQKKLIIFTSESLLTELETTLKRDKFKKQLEKRNYTTEYLMMITEELTQKCVTISFNVPDLRDNKDHHIIATAISAKAEVLITGDLDLLILEKVGDISIMNPTDFLNTYKFL